MRDIIISLRYHHLVNTGPSPTAFPAFENAVRYVHNLFSFLTSNRAIAVLDGRSFVTPTHVTTSVRDILSHRVTFKANSVYSPPIPSTSANPLGGQAQADQSSAHHIISHLLTSLLPPV